MHNEYNVMMTLTATLNSNLLNEIISTEKSDFVNNENLVNVSIGIIDETKKIIDNLPSDFYILNPFVNNFVVAIRKYHSSLLNYHLLVNTYRLYDFIKIELQSLKKYLNSINN